MVNLTRWIDRIAKLALRLPKPTCPTCKGRPSGITRIQYSARMEKKLIVPPPESPCDEYGRCRTCGKQSELGIVLVEHEPLTKEEIEAFSNNQTP